MSRRPEAEIEAILRARTGRDCIYLPSGRFALLLALLVWFTPDTQVLMSPVTDDVIFFIMLAAGLRPVMAPLSPADGNIDVDAVPESTWSSIGGVMTTNLYGLPDRVTELARECRERGIPLIEDAAHAIDTDVDGRPVGTFGAAAAFSFSKHVGACSGGVLAIEDDRRRPELERLRDELLLPRPPGQRLLDLTKPVTRRALATLGLVWPIRRARDAFGLYERSGSRMDLHAAELRAAIAAGREHPERFERWTPVDRHDHRMHPTRAQLDDVLARLRALPAQRARRLAGVEALAGLEAVAPGVARLGGGVPLFRVPLLVEHRKKVADDLFRRDIGTYYIFDPPLDDYAGPEFATPSVSPHAARWWASHALPIDPLDAGRALKAFAALPEPLEPAPAPVG